MKRYLLDTHTWIWWNVSPQKLSKQVLGLMSEPENYDELLLSAISPWEFSKLLEKKRIHIACDGLYWIQEALKMPRLRVVELSPEIAYLSTQLPQPFHDDPADQMIAATARHENATIITKDELLRKYPHIKTLW